MSYTQFSTAPQPPTILYDSKAPSDYLPSDAPPPYPNTHLKPDYREKKEYADDAASTTITTTTTTTPSVSASAFPATLGFTPTKSLHIDAKGCGCSFTSSLTTAIHNTDGTLAYVSTREKRSSNSCVLADATGHQLLATTYRIGYGSSRQPKLTRLDGGRVEGGGDDEAVNTITTSSKWTSRAHEFHLPDGRTCVWAYESAKGYGSGGKKGTALVLRIDGMPLATLLRNRETRAPGSSRWSVGNGGELVLGERYGEEKADGADWEAFVVASCLLMLKKEKEHANNSTVVVVSW